MKIRILAMLGALVAALCFAVVNAAPAQALGWSGQRCDPHTSGAGADGFTVCTQFHTVSLPNGKIWIDAIQVCHSGGTNHIQNLFQNGWGATGGAWGGFPNVAKNSCNYTYPTKAAGSVGAGACYWMDGRVNRSQYPDTTWHTGGRVQGGAC